MVAALNHIHTYTHTQTEIKGEERQIWGYRGGEGTDTECH